MVKVIFFLMATCLLSNALTACCLPFLNTPGNGRGRTSSQAQKKCFSNFSENFSPPASVPGHAMHSIPPGWLFSKAWGVTFHLKVLLQAGHVWAALHLRAVWMPVTHLLFSGQSHSSQGSLAPPHGPPFTFLTTKCFPSFLHQETL